jgi:putative tryptophan/tyrosine transport system substrate-binding protein
MKRREFITLIGGAAAAWPLAARAQQSAVPVAGFLGVGSPDKVANDLRAFHQGLGETGFVGGRNVAIEFRWADGQNNRLPALAADLVRRQVNVIVAPGSTAAALAARAASKTIPIVFWLGGDPVRLGLVDSLNHPGGNVTGVTTLGTELGPKRLELMREALPTATIVALLINPSNPNAETQSRGLQTAALTFGLKLHVLHASSERDFNSAFETLLSLRADALVIAGDGVFNTRIEQLAALTVRHAVPAIYQYRQFAAAGGLMSYGGSLTDSYRLTGVYTGRVLKGEMPADMPVQQATKLELILNLKTAKALGLDMPPQLLARADEVIE